MKKFTIIILFLLLNVSSAIFTQKSYISLPKLPIEMIQQIPLDINIFPLKYRKTILELEKIYPIPLKLLHKVIAVESGFNPNSYNYNYPGSYDIGLMQLNSNTYPFFKKQFNNKQDFNVYNPYSNLRIGMAYLYYLYQEFGNWILAVAAYNAGDWNIQHKRYPKITVRYLKMVFN